MNPEVFVQRPPWAIGERSHQALTARLSSESERRRAAKQEAASLVWKEFMSKSRASRSETGGGKLKVKGPVLPFRVVKEQFQYLERMRRVKVEDQ